MEYILPESALAAVAFDTFVAVQILDIRRTSRVVKYLNDLLPLDKHGHLRRIKSVVSTDGQKSTHVLLCPESALSSPFSETAHLSVLTSVGLEGHDLAATCYLTQVAQSQSLTRTQFDEAKVKWPCFFHEDKILEQQLKGGELSSKDIKYISLVQELSLDSPCNIKCGAIIVDTQADTVVGKGCSQTDSSPFMHAVMVCLDSVAKSQGGGAWLSSPQLNQFYSIESATASRGDDGTLKALIGKPSSSNAYLCTGYKAYLTDEPCPMCAMALLHSRIGSIHYVKPSSHGALGTLYRINTMPELNHRFAVTRTKKPSAEDEAAHRSGCSSSDLRQSSEMINLD